MFGIEKELLLKNLEKLRKNHCCYMGDVCDCKYLIENKNDFDKGTGEITGCPELRMAINMLSTLSEKEFTELAKKAKIRII